MNLPEGPGIFECSRCGNRFMAFDRLAVAQRDGICHDCAKRAWMHRLGLSRFVDGIMRMDP